ncbi:hypothetical protein BKA64DRAFT_43650 [Cadophora sp. MPI-SDFR-AT-0126]|nr:hypothetical protein BKA64DRAFT_43650 [Leotiomycetes sp. MPI-SDFR-AT-0126]
MRVASFLSLLSVVAALPTFTTTASEDGVSIVERDVSVVAVRTASEDSSPNAPAIMARTVLLDQTYGWPADKVVAGTYTFQTIVTNLNNGNFGVEWWWSGAANWPDVELTITSSTGASLFTVRGGRDTSTHGTSEIAQTGDQFRIVFDSV